MPERLLAHGDLCGATLLSLVASGSALIAELLRLAQRVPEEFLDSHDSLNTESMATGKITFDFAYLHEPEEFENFVNTKDELINADVKFQQENGAFAQRFYALVQGIVNYWKEVQALLDRLASGYFITHTVDSVLEDVDGRQLLCEAFFLYGTLLLLLEERIPGIARERLVIACYRLRARPALANIDEVCMLTRSNNGRLNQYPDNLLCQLTTKNTQRTVKLLIQRLMSDDIYLQSTSFPSPEHRSIRLASQASMLYVILYFDAETLRSQHVTMREIVDKHFSDNWVIPVYMGHFVDLSLEWVNYYAATVALTNVLTPATTVEFTRTNSKLISQCILELDDMLTEGQLTEDYLLNHSRVILDCIRRCNAALRWRLLHRRSTDPQRRRVVTAAMGEPGDADSIVTLLLKASQLEYRVKQMIRNILGKKMSRWESLQQQVINRMNELSRFFAGDNALAFVRQDKKMAEWFSALEREATLFDVTSGHRTLFGQKIQTFVTALEEVEHFDSVDTNLHIKALLAETRTHLLQMVSISGIAPDVVHVLEAVSDLSYAWGLLGDYVPIFHERVRTDPTTAVLLRATFLKLASILDVPLVRISQCASPDAPSVAAYYSGELVAFVRRVLDVIPVSVFGLLDNIVQIQTHSLRLLPTRLESAYLLDYAQLFARYHLARLTHRVAFFTESVLVMESTLLGVIRIDPRRILHDGLRTELIRLLTLTLDQTLHFPALPQSWVAKRGHAIELHHMLYVHGILDGLAKRVDAYRRSVEYVQDYIDVAGLKMWQDELACVVRYSVAHECDRYLDCHITKRKAEYQSKTILASLLRPLSTHAMASDCASTFLGRTLTAILRLTTPHHTSYAPERAGWYTDTAVPSTPGNTLSVEICGIRTFQIIEGALGVVGLVALDRMLAFNTVRELARFYDEFSIQATTLGLASKSVLKVVDPEPHSAVTKKPAACYMRAVQAAEAIMPGILHRIQAIGHAQLLRRSLTQTILQRSRIDAEILSSSTTAIDAAILGNIFVCDHHNTTVSRPDTNRVLVQVSVLVDAVGLSDLATKIYVANKPPESLSPLLLLFLLTYAHKLHYDGQVASLIKRKASYPIDGSVIVAGIQSVLKQYHPSYTYRLLADLSQFVCVTLEQLRKGDSDESMPLEVLNTIWFIHRLCTATNITTPVGCIPAHILAAVYTNNVSRRILD